MDEKDIWPLVLGKGKEIYDHVTCGWGPFVMIRDKRWWYNTYLWGESPLLYFMIWKVIQNRKKILSKSILTSVSG